MEKTKKKKRKKEENKKRRSKRRRKKRKRKKSQKKKRIMEVKKIAEKWKIWDNKKEVIKSEEKAKKLVSQRFYKWIHVFRKKASERMLIKKVWDHVIETKERFVSRKVKAYLLSREEKGEVCEFVEKQLKKGYIQLLKLFQTALVFFVGKKDSKK